MEDIIQLAITMTEMDTGIELSPQERQEMLLSILAKIEDTNRQCPLRAKGGLTFLLCAELDSAPSRLYNRYMSLDDMMLREEIAKAIEAIPIKDSITNALGMRILAAQVARGENNYVTNIFEEQVDFE